MDMTLYALLMGKLEKNKECSTWNGFKIEVVDEIPTSQVPNTIYFVKSTISLSKEGIVDENGNNIVDENGNYIIYFVEPTIVYPKEGIVDENGNNIVNENGYYIVGSDS